jgi:hypothetical protein
MSEWTGKSQIFQDIRAFDGDIYDVPNMLRVPFIPELSNVNSDPLKTNCIPERLWTITSKINKYGKYLTKEDVEKKKLGFVRNTFIYGAPGIAAREWLSEGEYTFFAATHRDGEYSIVKNPDVDNDLMMETYGKINLSKFFLNHLSMTIDFMKYIGSEDRNYTEQVKNEEIVRNNFNNHFETQLASGFKAGAKKLHIVDNLETLHNIELER